MSAKKINTENLIHILSSDLKPAPKRSWKKIKLWLFTAVGLLFTGVLIFELPPQSNYLGNLQNTLFFLINLNTLLLVLSGIYFIHHVYDFGQEKKKVTKTKWTFLGLFILLISLTAIESILNLKPGQSFQIRGVDWFCFNMATMISIPVYIGLNFLDIYFPKLQNYKVLTHIAIGISTGILVDHIHCPVTGHGHQLIGHTLLPITGAIVASFAVSKVFELIQKAVFMKKYKALQNK